MKYRLKIADETADLDVSNSDSEHHFEITIGEKVYNVYYQAISHNHFHMLVNGKATEAFVVQGDGEKQVFVNGRTFSVEDEDRLSSRRAKGRRPDETQGEVTPPMPAVVVRILVEEGELVKKGQGLVVVSAMKMETTLVAPSDGRVKKINTFIDAKVSPGEILVEIEKEVSENG